MTFKPSTYDPYDFANRRHIGPSPEEMSAMLETIGTPSIETLIDETVPMQIRQNEPLSWEPMTEHEVMKRLRDVADKNTVMHSLIGQGYYGTVTPPRSNATCSKTRLGTRPIPLISRKFPKVALKRS